MTLIIIVGIALLVAAFALRYALGHAPEGYQNSSGFHVGRTPQAPSQPQVTARDLGVDSVVVVNGAHAPTDAFSPSPLPLLK